MLAMVALVVMVVQAVQAVIPEDKELAVLYILAVRVAGGAVGLVVVAAISVDAVPAVRQMVITAVAVAVAREPVMQAVMPIHVSTVLPEILVGVLAVAGRPVVQMEPPEMLAVAEEVAEPVAAVEQGTHLLLVAEVAEADEVMQAIQVTPVIQVMLPPPKPLTTACQSQAVLVTQLLPVSALL